MTKLWRTIKGIDGKTTHQAENKTRKQILPSCGERIKGFDGKTTHQAENKTRKQILPSCGEQLRELMAKQLIKQRTRPENRYYQAVEND